MTADYLAAWMFVFLRASGLMAVFPVFSTPGIPVRVRVALGAVLSLLVVPGLPSMTWAGLDLVSGAGVAAIEIGVGLFLGFVCRLVFYALETAGTIISTEIGLNLPASFSPSGSMQSTLPAALLNHLAAVLWLSLDLHHWLILAFQRSYALLPVGAGHVTEPLVREVLSWVGWLFVSALQISAPVLAVSFLISLVFSVLGRAVSQMNVFTESFAVRLFSGLTFFGLSANLMAKEIADFLGRLPEGLLRMAQLLGQG